MSLDGVKKAYNYFKFPIIFTVSLKMQNSIRAPKITWSSWKQQIQEKPGTHVQCIYAIILFTTNICWYGPLCKFHCLEKKIHWFLIYQAESTEFLQRLFLKKKKAENIEKNPR